MVVLCLTRPVTLDCRLRRDRLAVPTVEENLSFWGERYDWWHAGESWSNAWGSTQMLWSGVLRPRIDAFVPTGRILEIAPGFGRFTHYLRSLCDHLTVVDLNRKCVEACQARFADSDNIEYHVNDGRSLEMVPDGSIDFVFSFDSLVHADADAVESYVRQLGRKLTPNGAGFIHHSNIGAYGSRLGQVLPKPLATSALKLVNRNWRDERMSADLFAELCADSGLVCIAQEPIEWWPPRLLTTDCFSAFAAASSQWVRPRVVRPRRFFMREAKRLAEVGRMYGAPEPPERAATGSSRAPAAV